MMGYAANGFDGYRGMMSGGGSILMLLVTVIVLVDLVLLGMWLWKQIKK